MGPGYERHSSAQGGRYSQVFDPGPFLARIGVAGETSAPWSAGPAAPDGPPDAATHTMR